MTIEENWGISIQRARLFWESQPDVAKEGSGYRFGNCRITISELTPGTYSMFSLPRTQLCIEGPETEAQSIHHRFWIRFLSAGG